MSRDDDTGELPVLGDAEGTSAPGEPVGRVNLPEESDLPPGSVDSIQSEPSVVLSAPRDQMREKVLYGLMAVVMMILAMVVILQGVFEQKMPI